ncbi:hypothetical protein [Vibrio sp. CyArs1]|uniref:hypothetical protein n=1 Tax=Vibrio sp. CyArs1 TaxID=2682577 RepID=UPI001F056BEA|nr:hypothetical protein [Vibrio sp. CyArs1]
MVARFYKGIVFIDSDTTLESKVLRNHDMSEDKQRIVYKHLIDLQIYSLCEYLNYTDPLTLDNVDKVKLTARIGFKHWVGEPVTFVSYCLK